MSEELTIHIVDTIYLESFPSITQKQIPVAVSIDNTNSSIENVFLLESDAEIQIPHHSDLSNEIIGSIEMKNLGQSFIESELVDVKSPFDTLDTDIKYIYSKNNIICQLMLDMYLSESIINKLLCNKFILINRHIRNLNYSSARTHMAKLIFLVKNTSLKRYIPEIQKHIDSIPELINKVKCIKVIYSLSFLITSISVKVFNDTSITYQLNMKVFDFEYIMYPLVYINPEVISSDSVMYILYSMLRYCLVESKKYLHQMLWSKINTNIEIFDNIFPEFPECFKRLQI
jgi:hypothetical protein